MSLIYTHFPSLIYTPLPALHPLPFPYLHPLHPKPQQTTGYENLAAARLAIQDINANKSFLPDYYFDMKFKDDGCDRKIGLKALSNVYSKGERWVADTTVIATTNCGNSLTY